MWLREMRSGKRNNRMENCLGKVGKHEALSCSVGAVFLLALFCLYSLCSTIKGVDCVACVPGDCRPAFSNELVSPFPSALLSSAGKLMLCLCLSSQDPQNYSSGVLVGGGLSTLFCC